MFCFFKDLYKSIKEANTRNALTGILTCNKLSQIDFVDYIIPVIVGPEVIAGSTRMKAGTATKLILNMISTTMMIKLNKTYGNF